MVLVIGLLVWGIHRSLRNEEPEGSSLAPPPTAINGPSLPRPASGPKVAALGAPIIVGQGFVPEAEGPEITPESLIPADPDSAEAREEMDGRWQSLQQAWLQAQDRIEGAPAAVWQQEHDAFVATHALEIAALKLYYHQEPQFIRADDFEKAAEIALAAQGITKPPPPPERLAFQQEMDSLLAERKALEKSLAGQPPAQQLRSLQDWNASRSQQIQPLNTDSKRWHLPSFDAVLLR